MKILKIKKLSNVWMPIKAYDDCAGYDLAGTEHMLLLPHSSGLVKTDPTLEIV